uniref:Uncharacterized protein n=1 Tax=Cacopsylla melanoneura TaxID=428564 RepID=A0A8D8XGJ5_9HEMI
MGLLTWGVPLILPIMITIHLLPCRGANRGSTRRLHLHVNTGGRRRRLCGSCQLSGRCFRFEPGQGLLSLLLGARFIRPRLLDQFHLVVEFEPELNLVMRHVRFQSFKQDHNIVQVAVRLGVHTTDMCHNIGNTLNDEIGVEIVGRVGHEEDLLDFGVVLDQLEEVVTKVIATVVMVNNNHLVSGNLGENFADYLYLLFGADRAAGLDMVTMVTDRGGTSSIQGRSR